MKSRTIPSRNYGVEEVVVDLPASVEKKCIGAKMTLTRENRPAGVDWVLSDGQTIPNIAIVIRLLRSVDGVNFIGIAEFTFTGGTAFNRDGSVRTEDSQILNFWDGSGVPLSKDGDLRVVFISLVPVRVGATFDMLEPGDI